MPATARQGVKRLAIASAHPVTGDKLTVGQVCAELQIAESTFYEWRTKGTSPRCTKLPNGQLRIRRTDLDKWLNSREDAA